MKLLVVVINNDKKQYAECHIPYMIYDTIFITVTELFTAETQKKLFMNLQANGIFGSYSKGYGEHYFIFSPPEKQRCVKNCFLGKNSDIIRTNASSGTVEIEIGFINRKAPLLWA